MPKKDAKPPSFREMRGILKGALAKRKAGQPVSAALRAKIVDMLNESDGNCTLTARRCKVTWPTVDKIRHEEGIAKHPNGLNRHALPKEAAKRIAARFLDDDRPSDDTLAGEFGVSRSVIRRIRANIAEKPKGGRGARLDASEATRVHIADKDELGRRQAEIVKLHRRISEIEDLRAGILGLGEPKKPKLEKRPPKGKPGTRSAILHLSDVHYAEAIDLDEMDGINSFNAKIADNRLNRSFNTVARLLTEFWHGAPVERIHICLGGDLVSGGIHPELVRTDELLRLPSAKAVASRIADGVAELRSRVGAPVSLYSVPGNHGRLTTKPETKAHVPDNLDTLCAWFLGTEWGRDLIAPDLWAGIWAHRAKACHTDVVVDDLRFPNEVEAVRALGGIVIAINRPGIGRQAHASEGRPLEVDLSIINEGTIEELRAKVDRLIAEGLVDALQASARAGTDINSSPSDLHA